MKKNYVCFRNSVVLFILTCLMCMTGVKAQVTLTFSYTGAVQNFTVPTCVSTITADVRGAQGGGITGGLGGNGGRAQGVFTVTPGEVLQIYVGGAGVYTTSVPTGGFNGGAGFANLYPTATLGGTGGGASDIRRGVSLSNRIIVGGGGGGGTTSGQQNRAGGVGGGLVAGAGGFWSTWPSSGGMGGTQIAGGAAGVACCQTPFPGTFGIGGNGDGDNAAGCGGGGGWYGGGGGLFGGGGGGSDYLGYSGNTFTSSTAGFQSGNGQVILIYNFNGIGINASASNSFICAGGTTTLAANGMVSYTWSPGGSTSSSIAVSPTSNTNYTVMGTNAQGCNTSSVLAVAVNTTVPSLTVVSTASALCFGRSFTLTANGANTYTWTNGVINAASYTPAGTSDYTVTGFNGCGTSTAVTSVTVNPSPVVTGSANNPTVCNGSPVVLNAGGNASTYSWSSGILNNVAFTPLVSGNYTVTGGSVNGCTSTAVVGVTVLITPTVTPVVTPTAICLGGTATLSAAGATGYTWTPGNNLTAATVTVSPPAATTFTLFRNNGVCSSTSTIALMVNPLPLVNASASPSQICAGTGINLLVFGAITYTWLPGNFSTSNFTVYPNFSTNYTVTGSNGNCTTAVVVPIVVNPTPTIAISSATNTICQGSSLTLTASGGQTYTWQPSNGNLNSTVVTPNTTTIVTVSATSSLGCMATQNQLILVNPLPNMNLSSSLAFICVGQTAQLSITSPTANVNYNWSTGAFGTSISVNPSVTTGYFATGTNTITGCTNTNTIALAVYISSFVVTSPTAICKGETATLTASGPATNYAWSTINGTPIGTGVSSVTVSPALTSVFYVTGSNVSCSSTQSVNLIVNPIPNVTAQTAKSTICRFEVSTISGNGAASYSWNTGAITPTISFTLSVTSTYTLTGTDLNNCSKTVTVTQFVATCIGVEEHQALNSLLNIYPNPSNGDFTILATTSVNINLVNDLGQVLKVYHLTDNDNKVQINHLAKGVYFILAEKDGLVSTRKLVIQ